MLLLVRRIVLILFWALAMPIVSGYAQSFPDRPVALVVPWPAGGPTDRMARVLAELVGVQLRQPVVIENKPGAGGTLGIGNMAGNARADGYTVGLYSSGMLRVPHLQKTAWHPINDFTFITGVAASTGNNFGFVVRKESPYQTFQAFAEAARRAPGELTYGSAGIGSTVHLLVEELA